MFCNFEKDDYRLLEINPRMVEVNEPMFLKMWKQSLYKTAIALEVNHYVDPNSMDFNVMQKSWEDKKDELWVPKGALFYLCVVKPGRIGDLYDFEYAKTRVYKHFINFKEIFEDKDYILDQQDITPSGFYITMSNVEFAVDYYKEVEIWNRIRRRLQFEIEGDPVAELEELKKK